MAEIAVEENSLNLTLGTPISDHSVTFRDCK